MQHPYFFGGGDGDRTHDLLNANQALSQLSYTPKYGQRPSNGGLEWTRTTDPRLIRAVL